MSTSRAAGDRNRRRPTRRPAIAASPPVVPLPAVDLPGTAEGDAAPAVSFAALGVPAPLCAALARRDITVPFPIQAAALPSALAGRDVLGRGRTGSGKTVAFAVPLVAALAAKGRRSAPKRPRGLVLVPTRELATQVAETLAPLAAAVGLRTVTVMGGVGMGPQVTALRRGVDVVVACPGRLEDLIGQGHCALDAIDVTVIDEADHMADLGFLPAVRRILDRTPSGTQRLLFSATLDNGIDVLVRRYLNDPVTHSVDSASVPQAAMAHHVFTVSTADKAAVVRQLAGGQRRSLLFTRTKHGARKLARQLAAAGIPAGELHSNLSQGVRARNLAAFGDGSTLVLVATDIAARGIHVDDIGLVVHVDPPAEHKAFLHRSGRTARAGADGTVVTLATPEQRADVHAIARKAGIRAATAAVTPGDTRITAIVGPPAPLVRPRPQVAAPAPASRPRRSRSRRSVA
jgi:superfamily II DNA/RNA helicase